MNMVSLAAYCRILNIVNFVSRKKHRTRPVGEDRIRLADDGQSAIYFCRQSGARFRHGVMTHIESVVGVYHLDQIDIEPGGVFIDCGANIGELGLWARERGLAYIPFEPEALEARCCDLNNFDGHPKTRRKALWNETAVVPFYSKPESYDSSLIDMGDAVEIQVQTVTLDGAVDLSNVSGTVILKVEAEGAEPEVLEGAKNTLISVDWVTIDCGPERGMSKAHTFVETNVFMQSLGFCLHRAEFNRVTALYRNMRSPALAGAAREARKEDGDG